MRKEALKAKKKKQRERRSKVKIQEKADISYLEDVSMYLNENLKTNTSVKKINGQWHLHISEEDSKITAPFREYKKLKRKKRKTEEDFAKMEEIAEEMPFIVELIEFKKPRVDGENKQAIVNNRNEEAVKRMRV